MPSSKDGIMVILSSPSGAGKTTLVNLLSNQDNFKISISHTTRKPRPGEVFTPLFKQCLQLLHFISPSRPTLPALAAGIQSESCQ